MAQLSLELDWGREPWSGFRPRCLTKGYEVWLRYVDKSRMLPEPARDPMEFTDPAQLTAWVSSTPSKEV